MTLDRIPMRRLFIAASAGAALTIAGASGASAIPLAGAGTAPAVAEAGAAIIQVKSRGKRGSVGRRHSRRGHYAYRHRNRNPGAGFAAGLAGAIIGGALMAPYAYGVSPYAYGYYPPATAYPVYPGSSAAAWCARRYPTYDPTTGLYTKSGRWYRCP